MSSISEEIISTEEVQSIITEVADDASNVATEDCNVDDVVNNELVESKSGRKIKPSRRMYDNYDDRKKSKSKGSKRSKRPSITALVELESSVDKTAAVEIPSSTPAVCGYCHKGHLDDPLESGKMFSIAGVTTHYFCMLFTYNSSQLGADSEGLFGFYGEEVKNQIQNGKKKCKYCGKRGATARCNKKHCGVYMHFPCGQESGATFQFMGKMYTFCFMHRVKQKVETFPTPPDTDCVICYEKVDHQEDFKKIRAPCCGRHFHRDCVQRFAMTSGTQHFKCPNCNNQEEITKEFKKNGVYIPYKDAEWELPASQSFYNWSSHSEQTKRCCAKDCVCEEGRNFNDVGGDGDEIILCDLCGTNGVHIKCGKIDEDTLDYACVDCGGEVALEERTIESRNSSIASSTFNLSLASTVDDSLASSMADSSASTVDDSFNSDKDTSTSSMPNIRDFIKQFEITPSQDSLLKSSDSESSLSSLFREDEQSRSELSEEVLSKRPHKKRGPKSKTQPPAPISTPPITPVIQSPEEDSTSKHSFFKHTEEVTKMLEDLKRKEQETKSKNAFFKSLTAAQTSEKKEAVSESWEASLDFKNYLAKSLGKEETSQVAPSIQSDAKNYEFEEIQSKIDDLTKTIGLPSLDAFTFESPAYTPAPAIVRTIKVRTDLLARADIFESNNIMETEITLSEETDIESMEDDDISSEGIEISEKKRAFGSFLLSKQKVKVSSKKESSYIEFFYQHMDKSDAAVKNVKQVEENETANNEPSVSNILEDSIDVADENQIDEITLNEMNDDDIPEETAADTSLGLEIVDTFTCSDSFIDELLNSPVKSPAKKAPEGPTETTPHEDEEISDNNDAPGTNLIDAVPSLASPLTKSVVEAPKVTVIEPVNVIEPVKAVITKPKAGPRSRTKPSEPPVQRTSPTKIKESIAENIKIFEEEAKALKSKPLDLELVQIKPADNVDIVQEASYKKSEESVDKDTEEAPKKNSDVVDKDMEKPNDVKEPETTVKYRPGPKSRKKYLVVKEDEPKEKSKMLDSSPKRSFEPSDVHVAKKQKTEDFVSEDLTSFINLDSTSSSDGSNLEIIDLDKSFDASPGTGSASDPTKLDTSTKDIIREVTDLLGPAKQNIKGEEISKINEKESAPTDEAIVEITPPAIPSAATTAVSKRASKRPFQCPVCQGFFRSEMVLQQHLAKIHFWNRLLALPKEANTGSGTVFQCSEFPCRYIHKSQTIVAGHLATEHKVVFKIALNIFPDFKLPVLPTPSSDPSITILASVPARLPPVPTLQTEHSGKRSLSLSRPAEDQNKKPKHLPSQSVRPVILPSQPHKAVARVKPRTAPVQPTVQKTPLNVEAPLKPMFSPFPALPLPGQEYFSQKSLQSSKYNC